MKTRVGSVSFLNAKPLIYGLEAAKDLELSLAVPSKLLHGLRQGDLDVSPVFNSQRRSCQERPGLARRPSINGCLYQRCLLRKAVT